MPSPKRRSSPAAASIPSAPQPTTRSSVGDRAQPALDRRHEDRDRQPDSEQVAEVVVDERGGEVAPRTRRRPGRRSPRGRSRVRSAARCDHEHRGRRASAAIVASGRSARSLGRPRARSASRAAALGGLAAAAVARGPRGRRTSSPTALELRRPLAQPGAAVGALGHVRAHLGAAALADDAELGPASAMPSKYSPTPAPLGLAGRAICAVESARGRRRWRRRSRAGGGRRCRRPAGPRPRRARRAQPSSSAWLGEQLEQLARHLGRRAPARRRGSRSGRPSVPWRGGADLVVVDQLGRVLDQRLVVVVERAEPVGEARRPGPRARRCARPASAGRRPGSRPCPGSGAGARPTTGTCSPRSRPPRIIMLDPVGVDLPGAVVGRDAVAREGAEDRHPRRHQPGALPAPEGRVRPTGRAAAAGSGGSRRRRRSPGRRPRSPTWTWVPKISSLSGDEPELVDELVVAGAVDDLLVLPAARTGASPAAPIAQPLALGDRDHRLAQRDAARRPAAATSSHGRGRDLEHRLQQLRLHLALELGRDGGEQRLDLLRQAPARRGRGSSAPPRCRP